MMRLGAPRLSKRPSDGVGIVILILVYLAVISIVIDSEPKRGPYAKAHASPLVARTPTPEASTEHGGAPPAPAPAGR